MDVLLASPLPGFIWPVGQPHNPEFHETRDLAGHVAAKTALGCDFGNGGIGAPVYAMLGGVIYQKYVQDAGVKGVHDQLGDGSLVIRIRQPDGRNQGYAHFKDFAKGTGPIAPPYRKTAGTPVAKGQLIGHHGNSGGVPAHLHCHDQEPNGTMHEVYRWLEQSHDLAFNAGVDGVRIRLNPSLAAAVWGSVTGAGIFHDGKLVAPRTAILDRREVASVTADGFEWMPFLVPGSLDPVWAAKPFLHFV